MIIAADIVQLPSGILRLSASAIDPESDRVLWSYGQVRGPFVVEQARHVSDGVLVVDLAPTESGVYAFRATASDGALERSTVVSTSADITSAEPARSAASAAGQRTPPTSRFDIHITGQVVADEGLRAFALAGSLTIQPVSETPADQARNDVAVTIRTATTPAYSASRPGAVTLASELGGYDVLVVRYTGHELIATGPEQVGAPSPGQFKTAESNTSGFDIAGVMVTVRFSGETVAGTIDLSTGAVLAEALPARAEYSAQFTGTRVGR